MAEHLSSHRCYRLDTSLPLHVEMRDSLEETIDRATNKHNVPLFLTGGVSASLLARDAWPTEQRPLSRDLDFLVPSDPAVRAALEQEYGGSFKLNTGKAIFKSDKLQSHARNGVELDFIASSNIVHDDASIAVTVSPLAQNHAQREEFLGTEVSTLPSELVVIQKIFAGRGLDLGKFDLLDAESIIRSGRVDPALLRAFVLELTHEGTHRTAVVARLNGGFRRLSADVDTKTLIEALNDKPSMTEITDSIREDISTIDPL